MYESFQGDKQMDRNRAESITSEYLKPIYGFALKRCANLQDAEDLTQEIALKVFKTLLIRDDIEATDKFIWTVAHNTLANYYRDKTKTFIGVPIDELAEVLPSDDDISGGIIEKESTDRLHMEIAHLSKLQRRIVIAYYYENKKQEDIAEELGIPLGTVKWHLFKSKNELKKGMEIMRTPGELKFNPIKFEICGFSGSTGTKGAASEFFRSPLAQNIEYAVWKEAKTVGEIADELGVSPVYVESEAEYLEEYGFLTKQGSKYLCNILLEEPTNEINEQESEMYRKAAKLFANELYDELTSSDILDDPEIFGGVTQPFTFTYDPPKDKNFMMWALIPYIASLSGESLRDKSISFEEVCTIRPDGGKNICNASVLAPNVKPPMYFDSMKRQFGPCWNGFTNKFIVWLVDSEWSERRVTENYRDVILHDLTLLNHFMEDRELTDEEYAYLAERGYISVISGDYENYKDMTASPGTSVVAEAGGGCKKISFSCLRLSTPEIKSKLIAIGDKIKEKHWAQLQAIKAPYVKAVLDATPKHLHKIQKFVQQYIFFSDGWFILHCIKELVNNGKLKPPTEEQRKSLTMIIAPND